MISTVMWLIAGSTPAVLTFYFLEKIMAWDVYLNGKQIETVFFNDSCDKEYVLRSLIDHDGFPSDICIFRG